MDFERKQSRLTTRIQAGERYRSMSTAEQDRLIGSITDFFGKSRQTDTGANGGSFHQSRFGTGQARSRRDGPLNHQTLQERC